MLLDPRITIGCTIVVLVVLIVIELIAKEQRR